MNVLPWLDWPRRPRKPTRLFSIASRLTISRRCPRRRAANPSKVTFNELSRAIGLPGKPDGLSGSDVERYFREGRIQEIANYCETDVVNTYRIWLRYELFRGRLTDVEYEASEQNLTEFINARATSRQHLAIGIKVEVACP